MSSMRNAIQRRSHRERAQPRERQRLGLLEKHKDYALRAKDYAKKKTQLKALRRKAVDRNEDEFYFGMMSRGGPTSFASRGKRWNGTVEGDRGNKAMSVDAVRLLKTQDVGYVRTMRNVLSKEVSGLEERLLLARGMSGEFEDEYEESRRARKIVFVDGADDRDQIMGNAGDAADVEENLDDEEELGGLDDDDGDAEPDENDMTVQRLQRRLEIAKEKLRALAEAEDALDEQRAKMAKTATSAGVTKKGKKIIVHKRKR